MKRLHIIFIGIISISLSVASATARGEETFTDEMEAQLLEWINTARVNPLETAEAVGLDPDQVLADLPGLYDDLTQGLAPLRSDSMLTDAARSHTRDMLVNDFYGRDSQDGRTPNDRILEAGYSVEIADESLGMLGFFNFKAPTEAVFKIFSALYKGELNPERSRARNILNPEFKDVGIGFGAGKLTFQGVPYNVYLVTCDFAASSVSVLEMELLQLINQAREKPLEMARALGVDSEETLEGLPPVAFDRRLHQAAEGHGKDMIENDYFSGQSQDGASVEDRVAETGYEAEITGEAMGSFASSSFPAEEDAAFQIFATLFKRELDPERKTERVILNGEFEDGGVSHQGYQFQVEGEDGIGTYDLIVINLATSSLLEKPSLMCVVYEDLNEDGLYGLGEGIPNVPVTVDDGEASFIASTNPAGGLSLRLDPGVYTITLDVDGSSLERMVDLRDENLGLWFNTHDAQGETD